MDAGAPASGTAGSNQALANAGAKSGSGGSSASMAGGGVGMGGTAGDNSGSGGVVVTAGGSSAAGGGSVDSGPITCRAKGDGKSTITLINRCDKPLSFAGSKIQGGDLATGEHACRDVGNTVESIPAIRFWGYIGQDPGGERYTLAELTLNTDFNDFDWYNISHVDAHNLPMQVSAVDMPQCRTLTCAKSLLADCPAEGQLRDKAGNLISCYNPHRDDKSSVVALYFEAGCRDAYSWSGDDQESVVACAGEDYDVVFCP